MIDSASLLRDEQIAEVQRVLAEIGADRIPQVLVYNKVDRLDEAHRPHVLVDVQTSAEGPPLHRVFVSALHGTGLDELRQLIVELLGSNSGASLKLDRFAPSQAPQAQFPEEPLPEQAAADLTLPDKILTST